MRWVVVEEGKYEGLEGHIEAALLVWGALGWRMLLRLIESESGGGE